MYIEKPHVVSEDQLARLIDAMDRSTGKVFLGLTVGCCQCHDHKYDPL